MVFAHPVQRLLVEDVFVLTQQDGQKREDGQCIAALADATAVKSTTGALERIPLLLSAMGLGAKMTKGTPYVTLQMNEVELDSFDTNKFVNLDFGEKR